ncbi:retrovirus-related pol polyprotein from transposon TNT 1-94 [Tanacetum coccineum]
MNDLERNNMNFPTITINTKFLNSLQPELLKYETQVRLAKQLIVDSFDDLFDYLQQFEKLVNASRAKKLEKSHDPLALVGTFKAGILVILEEIADERCSRGIVEEMNLQETWEMFNGLFRTPLRQILQLFNATTAVEKDIMLGIIQSQGFVTRTYGVIRAENQNLLSTISELKTRLEKVEKELSINTRIIKKTSLLSALSSTRMNATSRVRRPMSRDSHVAHSVLDNSKKAAKNVAVYVRKNKQTDNTSANVIPNKENVIDVDVANASKAKTLLCVSCMKNVLIPCHDKCVAKHKLESEVSNVVQAFCGSITGYGDYSRNGNITIFHVYYVEGDDLLTGGRESNLYTISISDMAASSPVCLMSKATSTKSWDDYSRYTWVYFLRSKDETPEIIKKFIAQAQLNYKAKVCKIRTDNGIIAGRSFDFEESFAPVARLEAVRMFIAYAAIRYHYSFIWMLKKALYSLKQAPRAWYDKLSSFLIEHGFTKGIIDPTLFTRHHGGDILLVQDVKMIVKYIRRWIEISRCKVVVRVPKDTRFVTAMSTVEAEYVSLSACCAQVIWMRTQLLDYGYKYIRIPMYCDSKSAIAISCNPVQHSNTKHIDIRYHFIKEYVVKGTVENLLCRTGGSIY